MLSILESILLKRIRGNFKRIRGFYIWLSSNDGTADTNESRSVTLGTGDKESVFPACFGTQLLFELKTF